MKILISGASGLLGSKIAELAKAEEYQVFSGYFTQEPIFGQPVKLDITDKKLVSKIISDIKPDTIIHSAALTNVDECEKNKKLAEEMNVLGTRSIAKAAKDNDAHLSYVSTDYVFDGLKGMYKEEDITNPVNFYGESKLYGEKEIEEINEEFLIARTSVIYGARPASGKINFALWLFESLKKNQVVQVLTDQFISPTLNTNLAKIILEATERRLNGIYHMAGATKASRFEFAVKLAEIFSLDKSLIKKSCISDMDWIAKRPKDSSLDVSKTNNALKTKPMNLSEALIFMKEEMEFASRSNS
ncbi:MAG: dTDP-4-dehydrorhamnose reductase [Candidatus Bathyarchaeota archaeon]|nr:dTDP-4-dehydrorhamnose reductase [Candidatus Bathyarchaeota archaeon]